MMRLDWRRWVWRSVLWQWRRHLATAGAIAVATAVLAGSLVVGWSLQSSLRSRLLHRLGQTSYMVAPAGGVTWELGHRLIDAGAGVAELLELSAVASGEDQVGVPATLWIFDHQAKPADWRIPPDLATDEVILGESLARDLALRAGDWLIIRADVSGQNPAAGLFTRREPGDLTRTFRMRIRQIESDDSWAGFSYRPTQRSARNIFARREAFGLAGARANRIISTSADRQSLTRSITNSVALDDMGLRWDGHYLHSREIAFPPEQLTTASALTGGANIATHIAEDITTPGGRVSYGVVAATTGKEAPRLGEVFLNDWVATDLYAKVGDKVTLTMLVPRPNGEYDRKQIALKISEILPFGSGLLRPEVTPMVAGMTDVERLDRWKTPFPVDMRRVTPRDEQYWDEHRATPKAVIAWQTMQELWRESGYAHGVAATAIEAGEDGQKRFKSALGEMVKADPSWGVQDLRASMEAAGEGSSDFASLFAAMSGFLIVAALMIAGGVAGTGLQSRGEEMALVSAIGVAGRTWRALLLLEFAGVCVLGVTLGAMAGVGYAAGLIQLFVHLSKGVWELPPVVLDVRGGGLIVASLVMWLLVMGMLVWQVRKMVRQYERTARIEPIVTMKTRATGWYGLALVLAIAAAVLVGVARRGHISAMSGFFGGALGVLAMAWVLLRSALAGGNMANKVRMNMVALCSGFMRAVRPQVMLAFGMFLAGAFVVAGVAVFKAADSGRADFAKSGALGGMAFRISSPVAYRSDLGTAAGRKSLGLPADLPKGVKIYSLLSSDGTEGGCLNLALPGEMQVLGVGEDWIGHASFDVVTEESSGNPWALLQRDQTGGIPVFGDEETMQWIAKRRLGEVFDTRIGDKAVKVKLAGLVRGGLFSGQLLMDQQQLRKLTAAEPGYRYHFVEAGEAKMPEARAMFAPLAEFGFSVEPTAAIVEGVRAVQGMYMTMFVVLGGLGLFLGIGASLGVLVRDMMHRRGELSLLQAIGLSVWQTSAAIVAGHLAPLAWGVLCGTGAAVSGYMAFGRPVALVWPSLLALGMAGVGGFMLVAMARFMLPGDPAQAMRAE